MTENMMDTAHAAECLALNHAQSYLCWGECLSDKQVETYRGLFPDWATAIQVALNISSPDYQARSRRLFPSSADDPTLTTERVSIRRAEMLDGWGWRVIGVRSS